MGPTRYGNGGTEIGPFAFPTFPKLLGEQFCFDTSINRAAPLTIS
jgi:hypothetical protein